MNDSLALSLLAGMWGHKYSMVDVALGDWYPAWSTRESDRIKCRLCGGKVDPHNVAGHGRQHIAAIEGQYQSFWVVLSMEMQTKGQLYEIDVGDVVEEVFGFRPGTPEARQFWQEHGGNPP